MGEVEAVAAGVLVGVRAFHCRLGSRVSLKIYVEVIMVLNNNIFF